jgi:hypothetical protein
MFDFFARHFLPPDDAVRQVEFTTASPGVSAWSHWLGIEAQIHPLQTASASVRCDPGRRRFTGTTTNVARLALHVDQLPPGAPVNVELDGQKLENLAWPAAPKAGSLGLDPPTTQRPGDPTAILWLAREGERWAAIPAPPPSLKGPVRYGPFKEAFLHEPVLVYGTRGTAAENAWALAKARYDAEVFWYRGNGAFDVIPDTAFDAGRERDRSVILYGNRDMNAAWHSLLGDSPVQVGRGDVRIGARELAGEELACLFLRPRPGSAVATVGVAGGSGLRGMRLTDRLPYFLSGVAYPDCTVLGPETLSHGDAGIRAAGFFGLDWGVASGEWAWQ